MAYTTPEFVTSFQSEIDDLVTEFQTLKVTKDAESAAIPEELEDLDIELRSIRLTANSTFSANNPAGAYNPYPNAASAGHIEIDANQTVKITNGTVTITVSGSSVTVSGATTANFGAANITTTGNITGATVTGTTDVIADTINLKTHEHFFTDGGGASGTTGSTSGLDFAAHTHTFSDGFTISGDTGGPKNA